MATVQQINEAFGTLLGRQNVLDAKDLVRELRALANNYAQNYIMLGENATGEAENVCFHLDLINTIIENIENAG